MRARIEMCNELTMHQNKHQDSLSNLKSYKLSPSKQLERKLNSVSKHRHYAKDLVEEQKRKHFEQRRLEKEEKEIEQEQRQLIRRKQMLLRKQSLPNMKRAFPVFTAGRHDDDDSEEEDDSDDYDDEDEQTASDQEFDDEEEQDEDASASENGDYPGKDTEMTLKVLSNKLSSLESELECMKNQKKGVDATQKQHNNNNNVQTATQPQSTMQNTGDDSKQKSDENECDLTLDLESIQKTLQAVNERKIGSSKPVHVTLPSMPNLSQPPQLTATPAPKQAVEPTSNSNDKKLNFSQIQQEENKKVNTALNSLDVPSLLMLLDKLKVYFKEIQAEKKQNEEFRSTLLESVNAQNTQILHLLSQLASQQKDIETLKSKLSEYEKRGNHNMQIVPHQSSEARWVKYTPSSSVNVNVNGNKHASDYTENIALKDIKNIIEESRISKEADENVPQKTDWKSISSALPAKTNSFQHDPVPQQPYTVQKHHARRSFLPARSVQTPAVLQGSAEEQIHRISPPPEPVPKPSRKKQHKEQTFVEMPQTHAILNYPRVRVERYYE